MDPPAAESCRAAATPTMDGLVLRAVCPLTERESEDFALILCEFAAEPLNSLTKSIQSSYLYITLLYINNCFN